MLDLISPLCELSAFYTDLGISGGMKLGVESAEKAGREIEYRSLPNAHYFIEKKINLMIKKNIPPWWKFWKWTLFSSLPYNQR